MFGDGLAFGLAALLVLVGLVDDGGGVFNFSVLLDLELGDFGVEGGQSGVSRVGGFCFWACWYWWKRASYWGMFSVDWSCCFRESRFLRCWIEVAGSCVNDALMQPASF